MPFIYRIFLVATLILLTCGVYAQGLNKKNKVPPWVSNQGYWQIETNIHSPNKNIVYFYNNDHVMIYKEKVDGVVLNLANKQVKMRLKKALETVIQVWKRDRQYRDDQQMISMLFKK